MGLKPVIAALTISLALAIPLAHAQGLLDLGKNLLKGFGDSSSSNAVSSLTGGEITSGLREAL